MFTSWKKARAVAATKLAIQNLLLAFQYRPFSQSEPISEMLWTDEFFAGVFYNVTRAWAHTHLGRTPDPQELSDILGGAIEQATGSPQLAKAAVNTTSIFPSAASPVSCWSRARASAMRLSPSRPARAPSLCGWAKPASGFMLRANPAAPVPTDCSTKRAWRSTTTQD